MYNYCLFRGHMQTVEVYLQGFLLAVAASFLPIWPVLSSLLILLFVDTVFGIWASIKTKKPLTSARGGRIISKFFVWALTLYALYRYEQINHYVEAVKIAAGAIGFVEAMSILENANVILGQNIFSLLIGMISSKNNQIPKGDVK